jgi:tetratricopeptide (TPR) repeat protein
MEGSKNIDDILLLKSILSDIINETIKGIETAIGSGQFEGITSAKANAIRYIFSTSKALHIGNENDIEKAFNISHNEDIDSGYDLFPVLKTQILINIGAYYLGKHNSKESTERAKESIFLGQGKNAFCLPQAYRMYALVCLSKQQITETIEYLGFAVTNAEKVNNYHEAAISTYYLATAYFLYGDIYNSAQYAGKSIKQALEAGRTEWADLSRFLEGRIELELGNYKEAINIFESIYNEPCGNSTDDKNSLLTAWIYRCKIYIKENNRNLNLSNHDANLFDIEAAFLHKDYKKVIELSCAYKNPFSDKNFLFTEQVDWKSGFAQCEHLYFSNGEIEDRLKCMFHSLALSYQKENERDDALEKIQQILRDEKLCEMDPWNAFYFYAKYRILYNTCDDVVDMSTAVSIAFKRLQRRAGRIEDIETRRQYLNGAYWNKELSIVAKEFKLI